jgi:hypothetical protein
VKVKLIFKVIMLRFHRCSTIILTAYMGSNLHSNHTLSESYGRQIPIRTSNNPSKRGEKQQSIAPNFKFVIIGCGISGSAALGEILANTESSKEKDILLIDSSRKSFSTLQNSSIFSKNIHRLQFLEESVVNMDLRNRQLLLSDNSKVDYQNCLISVGTKLTNMEFGEKILAEECSNDLVDMSMSSSVDALMKSVESGMHVTLIGGDSWGIVSIASQLAEYSRSSGFKGTTINIIIVDITTLTVVVLLLLPSYYLFIHF